MSDLRFTLLPEGSSDRALIPILRWLLRNNGVERAIQSNLADVWQLPVKPRGLIEKIKRSVELYPCDLLFVHRDADREPLETRVAEIRNAVEEVLQDVELSPVVCVVPVRMQEAWLLFDEVAIRRAVGNPNGKVTLNLPEVRRVESLPNPKMDLYNLLRIASGNTGRRLRRLRESRLAPQVSNSIEDFAPLRALPAFQRLEADLRAVIAEHAWNS